MRNRFFIYLFTLLPVFSSCSDFLEIEPKEIIVLDKYWDQEADVEGIVAGCYSSMQSSAVIERMMVWGEFRSDNITGGKNYENNIQIANIFKENINASNTYAKWVDFYNVINRCNIVQKYAPQVAEKDPAYTQSKLNTTIAEVSALRDLMYFYLIRTFRDVPYTTEPFLDDNQTIELPATPFKDVLEALIEDLEKVQSMAVKRYPLTQTYYQRGRITQDAIHAMLCDLHLWNGDYQAAINYADQIINAKLEEYESKKNQKNAVTANANDLIDGYPLINDNDATGSMYGYAFDQIFGQGNSSESIFELIFMNDDEMLANDAVSSLYGNATTFPGLARPADFIGTDISDESFTVFLSKYDTRFYENMQPISGQSNTYGINKYTTNSTAVDMTKADIKAEYGKLYTEKKNHSNWIVYRLSDIMLMKAEALVELAPEGDNDADKADAEKLLKQAFAIINAINKRSNCSKEAGDKELDWDKYSSKSLMRTLVLEERQRELMFEGKRWYDLVRRSMRDGNTSFLVGQAARKGSDGGTAISSKLSRLDAIFWPYHTDELKVNKNLKQNPAFGSGENSSIVKSE